MSNKGITSFSAHCRIPLMCLLGSLSLATGARAADDWSSTGVASGLAVHLGSTDGALEAELAGTGRFVVRGLGLTSEAVAASRAAVGGDGRQYLASVAHWRDAPDLPMADETVNLLIADLDALGKQAPAEEELMRVLIPGDLAAGWFRRDGRWRVVRKPMPAAYDGWEQFWYDAQGTDTSRDTAVRPPTGIQYLHGFHGTSNNGMRLSGGRLVVERMASVNDHINRRSHDFVGRDAFNGLPQWVQRRPMYDSKRRIITRITKQKPFVLRGNQFVTLPHHGKDAKLERFDATTGLSLGMLSGAISSTPITDPDSGTHRGYGQGDLVLEGDTLFQVMGNHLAAMTWEGGERRWLFTAEDMANLRLPRVAPDLGLVFVVAAHAGHPAAFTASSRWPALYGFKGYRGVWNKGQQGKLSVLAIDMVSGQLRWKVPFPHGASSLIYSKGRLVYFSPLDNGGYPAFGAFDARTGKVAWDYPPKPKNNINPWKSWTYGYDFGSGKNDAKTMLLVGSRIFITGHNFASFDLLSGRQLSMAPLNLNTRCEQGRGTTHMICGSFSRFIDISGLDGPEPALRINPRIVARGSCAAGYWPAYGRLHYLGNVCGCANFLRGNLALHGRPSAASTPDEQRLQRGPAYGSIPATAIPGPGDWPVWLGSNMRNSVAASSPPTVDLVARWRITVSGPRPDGPLAQEPDWGGFACGRLENPVVAGGVAVVVDRQAHTVIGLDAATGDQRWRYTADARILTAPSLVDGWCVFGGRDGYVYCLRAADGVLAWRYQVAPNRRQIVAHGQLESISPLFGALPVVDGLVIAGAGHTPMTDGGMVHVALDLKTGQLRWRTPVVFHPGWQPMVGKGEGFDENQTGSNGVNDPTNMGGNLIRNGPLGAVDGKIIGDGLVLDAASGSATFYLRHKNAPDPAPIYYSYGRSQLHERTGKAHTSSANNPKPISVLLAGARLPIASDCPPAFDQQLFIKMVSDQLSLVPLAALSQPLKSEPDPSTQPLWSVKVTDKRHFGGQINATVLTPEEVIVAWRDGYAPSDYVIEPCPGALVRLRRSDGTVIQRIAFESAPMRGGLAVADNRLFVVCEDGSFHCFAAGD